MNRPAGMEVVVVVVVVAGRNELSCVFSNIHINLKLRVDSRMMLILF